MADVFTFATGRKALVTGGAGGIGLGVAHALRGVGATVAIADRPGALAAMGDTERDLFTSVPIDVTDDGSVRAGVAEAAGRLGGLDTVVNSAGVFQFRRLEDIGTEEWDRIIDVLVFLTDMKRDFPTFNRIWAEHFPPGPNQPTRTTIQIAALPQGGNAPNAFEIKVIASLP